MAHRVGLTKTAVMQAAAELVDATGLEALNLGVLAERLGVRTPSLYHYVPKGIAGLQRELALLSMQEQIVALGNAVMGKAGADALRAVAEAARAYIKAHPGLYSATMVRAATQDDPELQAAQTAMVDVFMRALDAYHFAYDDAIHAIRMLRILIHGTATLEIAGGFGMPQDVEETFHRFLTLYVQHLTPDQ